MMHNDYDSAHPSRRQLLRRGLGLGTAALASLLAHDNRAATPAPAVPRARRAIFLFMVGGPSQLDLWDYKPNLADAYDVDLPASIRGDARLSNVTARLERFPIAPPRFRFQRHGESGAWVSELLPWTARLVDDLCIIKSLNTPEINHDPAMTYLTTGSALPGWPSLGSWISYGLGRGNANLPTFVAMTARPGAAAVERPTSPRLWGAGFLPSRHQGVCLLPHGDPVPNLANPPGVPAEVRARSIATISRLNQLRMADVGDREIQSRIAQYELASRMQTSVPELTDLSQESARVLQRYGPDAARPGSFAASCLLARRLVERDVPFVQIFHRGWDHHVDLVEQLPLQCSDIDQPCYALICDLKERGLLDDTLVIWGGEFGRTVYCQGVLNRGNYGRDHHGRCFTAWLAGGGVKPGFRLGETDDFSFNVAADPVHVHDLNATILHCLGLDHERLTFPFQGADVRLTGFEDRRLIQEILQ